MKNKQQSILDIIPVSIADKIKKGNTQTLRDDLSVLYEAENKGWNIQFKDDNWHNSPVFRRHHDSIWRMSDGWTKAYYNTRNNCYENYENFGKQKKDLRKALNLDSYQSKTCQIVNQTNSIHHSEGMVNLNLPVRDDHNVIVDETEFSINQKDLNSLVDLISELVIEKNNKKAFKMIFEEIEEIVIRTRLIEDEN